MRNITDSDLNQFCIAVREKKDWQSKIFDENLALKWTIEAELSKFGSQKLEGEALEAVSELRRSVLTTRKLDRDISLESDLNHASHVAEIDSDMRKALKYARGSKYGIREPELKETGLGVLVSDNLVPESVHQELLHELNALAAKEPRDFHPGSFGKVQDLIHPSLYPYVAGSTPTSSPDIKLPPIGSDGKFHTEITNLYTQEMSSRFAWIPSVFKVSPDGTDVHIDSYINGLGTRGEFPSLFRVLEKMFLLALPHFEKTKELSETYSPQHSSSVGRWQERQGFASDNEGSLTRDMWNEFLDKNWNKWDAQKLEERKEKEKIQTEIEKEDSIKESFYGLGDELVASEEYKGEELKVIVKAANYTLAPGREYAGSWHMEGMPHERIVASVIYYYDTDPAIEDNGLSFRKFRDATEDFPNVEESEYMHHDFQLSFRKNKDDQDGDDEDEDLGDEDEEYEDHYPSDWETEVDHEGKNIPMNTSSIPFFINMGTVPTTNIHPGASNGTGRMLSFPNWLQHKVELVKNISSAEGGASRVATRKILCFFLVDDIIQNETYVSHQGFSFKGLQNMNVLTTSQIPMQMRKINEPTLQALLPKISARLTGTALPPELIAIIWRYVSEGTLSREEAEKSRLALMNDRRVKGRRAYREDTYSLCEH
ncbi:hypothetical protein GYMLUDRAFT_35681 [Collybiopsis luxurians FD-317 M1]|nr:hypothetical protein GYMLUDRAFT_35681 [Collybiopsis luxurians FD-317 M1]